MRTTIALFAALLVGCSGMDAEKMGYAAHINKENLKVAKANYQKALRTYDRELRQVYEREWRMIFMHELAKHPTLTATQVAELDAQRDAQRQAVWVILDKKLAEWLADDSLDQCLALNELQAEWTRQLSDTQRAFRDMIEATKKKETTTL